MADGKKIGDISVKMGDGNTVGQIGHNITFNAPPPSPNTIWQNGYAVGEIGSAPHQDGNFLTFEKLFFNRPFIESELIEVQGVKMLLRSADGASRVAYGSVNSTTLYNAKFELVDKA